MQYEGQKGSRAHGPLLSKLTGLAIGNNFYEFAAQVRIGSLALKKCNITAYPTAQEDRFLTQIAFSARTVWPFPFQ